MKKVWAFFLILLIAGCGNIKGKTASNVKKHITKLSDIRNECQDPKKEYKAVKSILSKSTYNSKAQAYQPITDPKGFLSIDFNQDNYPDFHFLEKKGQHIRFISCLSSGNTYRRRVTPFVVHETIEPDFQSISESISNKGKSLVLSVSKHEHNWGSDFEMSIYEYSKAKHQFILVSREISSSSGDGMRSDTFEFYDLVNKTFSSTGKCGAMEEGCKPYARSGRIKLPNPPATLFNNKKIYSRLINATSP